MSPGDGKDGPEHDDEDDDAPWDPDAVIEVAVTDILDLHTFRPSDVASLVRDYIDACAERGLSPVRIIHGKGVGTLRRTTHSQLDKHPAVLDYELAPPDAGGWGATIVRLKKE
jgi:DNA-nicking Smr family endonuclease